jgi:hypothetical protein
MTMEVPLTQGFVALVDDADYESVMAAGRWHVVQPRPNGMYAKRHLRRRPNRTRPHLAMHTFLTGWRLVDHINGDGLDNRMCNLREATVSQNNRNRPLRGSRTGYRGVYIKAPGRWHARLKLNGKNLYLGSFGDPADAARAYDAAAFDAVGEFARLNFPEGAT